MKIIVASDSFKGTLSSTEIAGLCARVIPECIPDAKVCGLAIADGGEGTVDAFVCMGARRKSLTVTGPLFEPVIASYAIFDEYGRADDALDPAKAAVIEMAQAAGLPIVRDRRDPEKTTTFGVGELIADALSEGCTHIILGLGGSATNDGGCGMAAALGVKFFDAEGKSFVPVGGTLSDIALIEPSEAQNRLGNARVTVMCDVNNPLTGENGAAFIFGPQKGADKDAVARLDKGLEHFADLMEKTSGRDYRNVPGAGAAGGLGAGSMWFLGAKLQSGIDTILDELGFDDELSDADCVITGEGRLDSQSFQGKVLSGIKARADKAGVAVAVIAGCTTDEPNLGEGLYGVYTTSQDETDFEIIRRDAAVNYENALRRFCEDISRQ